MKKILATLFCVALLAGPSMGHCGKCADTKPAAASCCAKKQAKKMDCCDGSKTAQKSQCSSKKMSKKSCCEKEVAKKECGPSCKMTNTWMTEPAKCNKCETASL